MLLREWLVTNGLGGYASGTVGGVATRRYHGLLVAALPAPAGRTMTLTHVSERVRAPGRPAISLAGEERAAAPLEVHGAPHLDAFFLEDGLPVWHYRVDGHVLEKRVFLIHEQNTAIVLYAVHGGEGPLRLKIRPSLHLRSHGAPVSAPLGGPFRISAVEDRIEISDGGDAPAVRLSMRGDHNAFTLEPKKIPDVLYRIERSRGYEAHGDMWSPGYFRVDVASEAEAALVCSTEAWDVVAALAPVEALAIERERRRQLRAAAVPLARAGLAGELVLATDQFLFRPVGRVAAMARARAAGEPVRSVIAGYHWFTDWGRDTMISLDGLALVTGRHGEAGSILRTFAQEIRDGLIPNLFPEENQEGLYHTADATLWFFQAVQRYVEVTQDRKTLEVLLPKMIDIVDHHFRGTRFGIGVDAADGLLHQGAEGFQLTWMDAKVDDWVVTPRRGKAVEINALFYNALKLLAGWLREAGDERRATDLETRAARARRSFDARFWNPELQYLYDVVDGPDGDDASLRPNQLLALSLTHPVLDESHWQPVLQAVTDALLTPVGLRTLAPDDPRYQPVYSGDLRSRDAAYHQGTVWPWLLGPYVDAWLRVHPGRQTEARELLRAFDAQLDRACIGSISEIFDATEPWTPRGCIAQAWSVAEVLRAWIRTGEE